METPQRRFKDAIYAQFARLGGAISAPKRIELLDLLCQAPRTVEALAAMTGITVANASQHLKVLRSARLVATEKKGTYVKYRIADDKVEGFLLALRVLAEARLAEVDEATREWLGKPDAMEPVLHEELLRRVRRGDVTVLDVRPAEEYDAGHVPGALSVPLPELKKRLNELPAGREIVAYCRGPYCVMAIDAVKLLRRNGFKAQRMEQGVSEWRARGWRVDAKGR